MVTPSHPEVKRVFTAFLLFNLLAYCNLNTVNVDVLYCNALETTFVACIAGAISIRVSAMASMFLLYINVFDVVQVLMNFVNNA